MEHFLLFCTIFTADIYIHSFNWYICTRNTMIQMLHRKCKEKCMTKKRRMILIILIAAGFVLGRLAMRAIGNLILGGTLFGGNFL